MSDSLSLLALKLRVLEFSKNVLNILLKILMQTIFLELLKFILTRYANLFIMTFANLTQLFIHAYYLKKSKIHFFLMLQK